METKEQETQERESTQQHPSQSKQEQELELNYVRNTYDQIADHFSNTRYNKWPKIHEFLSKLSPGTIILDIGCGNGKYLDSNTNLISLGCDSSMGLLSICRKRQYEVVSCDMMQLPFRPGCVDVIICIAALHHLASRTRRKQCLGDMIELLIDGGIALIYVWSFEQDIGKPNAYLKKSQGDSSGQELIDTSSTSTYEDDQPQTLSQLPVHKNRTPFVQQDLLVPFSTNKNSQTKTSETENKDRDNTYFRYYHVFKQGELDSMICEFSNVEILNSYYDHGNWCAEIRKLD